MHKLPYDESVIYFKVQPKIYVEKTYYQSIQEFQNINQPLDEQTKMADDDLTRFTVVYHRSYVIMYLC